MDLDTLDLDTLGLDTLGLDTLGLDSLRQLSKLGMDSLELDSMDKDSMGLSLSLTKWGVLVFLPLQLGGTGHQFGSIQDLQDPPNHMTL